jgi:hypothetical protein
MILGSREEGEEIDSDSMFINRFWGGLRRESLYIFLNSIVSAQERTRQAIKNYYDTLQFTNPNLVMLIRKSHGFESSKLLEVKRFLGNFRISVRFIAPWSTHHV